MAHTKMALNEKTALQPTRQRPPMCEVRTGLEFQRYFTDGRTSPFDAVEWERRVALIGNEKGKTIFRQEDVEVPKRLVADGDEHRRVKIFSRQAQHARARKFGAPAHRPRRERDRRLGRAGRLLRRRPHRATRSATN